MASSAVWSLPPCLSADSTFCRMVGNSCVVAIVGRELLAHDEDLLPLPGRGLAAGVGQLARRLQELILVAPHEEYFEELQSQIAARGFAGDGDADQIRGLVIQAVRHVEVSLRERVALVEVDRRLAADRLIARDAPRRGRRRRRSDRKSTRLNSSHSQISYAVFCLKKKKQIEHPVNVRNTHR